MDRGAWRATVYSVAESDTAEATQHSCIIPRHNKLYRPQKKQADLRVSQTNPEVGS